MSLVKSVNIMYIAWQPIETDVLGPYFESIGGRNSQTAAVKVARGRFSPIFAFSAHPSAELDLRVHNMGLAS